MLQIDSKKCTGCGLCAEVCSQGAITMAADAEGFLMPEIDAGRCKSCRACDSICPDEKGPAAQKGIAFRHGSESVLGRSASGGAFTAVADAFWESYPEGVVFGAAFDDELKVRHLSADRQTGCGRFGGSKYVQSDFTGVYREIEQLLEERAVLFSGTPCQAAALRKRFGEHKNLFLADLVCSGVPSQKAFETYLKQLSGQQGSKVTGVNFRNYRYFKGRGVAISFADGSMVEKSHGEDLFCKLFMTGLISGMSCYSCPYTTPDRVSDITLGDFHGIEEAAPKFGESRASLIIPHTKKGEALVTEALKAGVSREFPIESCLQPRLTEPAKMPMLRKLILKDFLTLEEQAFRKKYAVMLKLEG